MIPASIWEKAKERTGIMATITGAPPPTTSTFRTLSAADTEIRPLPFFFMEELLKSRVGSAFPTNAVEFDEDVNVYLSALLTRLGFDPQTDSATFGSHPQWFPLSKSLPREVRANWYIQQGEQRLLGLGLFERGDNFRSRGLLWGMSRAETRQRDLVCGQSCYQVAANLLTRGRQPSARAEIVRKVALYFPKYVQVLATLATGRWDLGAQLSERELQTLVEPSRPTAAAVEEYCQPVDMDAFLDELSAYRAQPSPEHRARLLTLAQACGIDPHQLNPASIKIPQL